MQSTVKVATKNKGRRRPEKFIEIEILTWLNMQRGCKAWKNKSQGTYNAQRGAYLLSRHRFSEKGSSDVLGIWRGRMLCIEVKSSTGKLMPHQADFLTSMSNLGAIAFMARSLEEVQARLAEIDANAQRGT